jgi:hypothetical protein
MARRHVVMEMQGARVRGKGKMKHSKKEPQWKRKLRTVTKSAQRQAWNLFALVGFVTVVILAIRMFGGG